MNFLVRLYYINDQMKMNDHVSPKPLLFYLIRKGTKLVQIEEIAKQNRERDDDRIRLWV